MECRIIGFPMTRKEKRKSKEVIKGSTVVGYARARGRFVSVSSLARKALTKFFLSSPTEEMIAEELIRLIEGGSLSISIEE